MTRGKFGSQAWLGRAWLGVSLCVALAGGACSLVSDTAPEQCKVDADCVARGPVFAQTRCGESRTCVSAPAGPKPCMSHQECKTAAGPGLCRNDQTCAPLLSPECPTLSGDLGDDGILIGSVFSVTGANAEAGKARMQSVRVALEEITANAVGVPLANKPRRLALIECDESSNLVAAAEHLVSDLRVPAIIGPGTSASTIALASRVSIPGGTLLISPSATSASITGLADEGLVWRTAPSDLLQVVAISDQILAAEAEVRRTQGLAANAPIKLSVLYKDDAYGQGLASELSLAVVNGQPLSSAYNQSLVQVLPYVPGNDASLATQVAAVAKFTPTIVVLVGTTEAVVGGIVPLEGIWPSGSPRPIYVASDGVRRPELLPVVAQNGDLRTRVRGTIPGSPVQSPQRSAFDFLYQSRYMARPSVYGMAGAYDSLYLIAYAMAAKATPVFTGRDLAAVLPRVTDPMGTNIDVGANGLGSAFVKLGTGGSIRLRGASGSLAFDSKTGDVHADVEIWCIGKDAADNPVFVSSGRYYDAEGAKMVGDYSRGNCAAP
jgi:ABC-type branched-subunit amino acid transport system substrate-binding protein